MAPRLDFKKPQEHIQYNTLSDKNIPETQKTRKNFIQQEKPSLKEDTPNLLLKYGVVTVLMNGLFFNEPFFLLLKFG